VAEGGKRGESINSGYGSEAEISGGLATNCTGDVTEDGGKGCPSGSNYQSYPMGGASRFGHSSSVLYATGANAANTGANGPGAGGRGEKGSSGASIAGKDGSDGEIKVFWFGSPS
jgi:hypothetical protein